MRAAIYARTSRAERGEETVTIANQVEYCRALAAKHNLRVEPEHVFTDVEIRGSVPPRCWVDADCEETRPALAGLIEAVEGREVAHVIVRRPEKLATSWDLLSRLSATFQEFGVRIITEPPPAGHPPDPGSAFAVSVLQPCIQFYSDGEMERRTVAKAKKLEEIERLKSRIARLESEISGL